MPKEPFTPVCIAEHCYGGGSVMVWAEISAQMNMDLRVIKYSTQIAERYVNEILVFMYARIQVL